MGRELVALRCCFGRTIVVFIRLRDLAQISVEAMVLAAPRITRLPRLIRYLLDHGFAHGRHRPEFIDRELFFGEVFANGTVHWPSFICAIALTIAGASFSAMRSPIMSASVTNSRARSSFWRCSSAVWR